MNSERKTFRMVSSPLGGDKRGVTLGGIRGGLLLLLAILLTSCDSRMSRILDEADRLLPDNPDSADVVLRGVTDWQSMGRGNQALYGLLRTKTDAMQGRGVGSDSIIRQAYDYYSSRASRAGSNTELGRRLGQSEFYFAQFYIATDSTKLAEDLLRKAIRHSDDAGDLRTCYMAHQYLGNLAGRSNQREGIELLKQSLYIYNRCNDKPANQLSILLDIGYSYLASSQFDSTAVYFDRAMQVADLLDSDVKRSEVHRAISSLHFYQQDYPTALQYAKQGQAHVGDAERDASLFMLAETYLYCDSLRQAYTLFSQLKQSHQTMIVYEAYRYLSQIAAIDGDNERALSYGDSSITASEAMYHDALSQKDQYYQDLLQNELQNEQLRYQHRMTILWVIIILLALAFIIYIGYRRLRIYIRRINLKRKRGLQIQRATIRQVQDLQEEVVDRRKELLEVKHITMEESRIYQQLRSGSIGSLDMTPSRWLQVEQLLDACSDHFVSRLKLKYPTISQSQLELCMLTRLGFSQNELADFYLRTVEAIKSRRKKLKAEVFGEKGSATSLDEIIENF